MDFCFRRRRRRKEGRLVEAWEVAWEPIEADEAAWEAAWEPIEADEEAWELEGPIDDPDTGIDPVEAALIEPVEEGMGGHSGAAEEVADTWLVKDR